MAGLFGDIAEFNKSSDDWESYHERLEFYFAANEVDDDGKKKAILLSSVGSDTYKLVRNLVSPSSPKDKTYDELTAVLKNHFSPAPSITLQRYKFNSAVRKSGQSVSEFIAYLLQLSKDCDFGDKLNDMLRDRLVCGIQDD